MSNYRRVKIEGAWYFFTVVTYKRRSFLTDEDTRPILKESLRRIKTERPFEMPVFCLLPDHLHCIWKMPSGDADYSTRWSLIKRIFSKAYLTAGGRPLAQTDSRRKKREVGIWQRRFWEHRIRDEDDYWNHVHYIHYNPIKHGLVKRLEDWPYSTYHRFCQNGLYDDFDWDLFGIDDYQDELEFHE
jgi:putative transposase